MLYDESQLVRVYLHAWQATGNAFLQTITEETLDYVVREMLDPQGVQMLRTQHLPSSSSGAGTAGFFSTQDADSAGAECKFFVWTPDEIRQVLGGDADAFMTAYGVTPGGNFEGKNIGRISPKRILDSKVGSATCWAGLTLRFQPTTPLSGMVRLLST